MIKKGKKKQKVRAVDCRRGQSLNQELLDHVRLEIHGAVLSSASLSLSLSILFYFLPFFLPFSRLCVAANWAVSLAYAVASPSARQAPDRLLKAHYCEVLRGRARNFSSPPANSSVVTTATLTLSCFSPLFIPFPNLLFLLRIFLFLAAPTSFTPLIIFRRQSTRLSSNRSSRI